jgi:ABC-type nitrate/sulfonate/bicarbonate transport system permease component
MTLLKTPERNRASAVPGAPAGLPRRRPLHPAAQKAALGLAGIAGFLLLWEAVPRLGIVDGRYLPPASDVLRMLSIELGTARFWAAVRLTMTSWAIGLTVAALAAAALGFIIGSSGFLRKLTHSTIEFLRPIPSVALIPLAVLLFGVKMESTLMLVIYACFWQVLIQVLYGVADIDSVANDTAKTYGLGRMARIRYVVVPTALPYVMTGLRLGAAVALILAITAELVIGTPGLGQAIALAQSGGAVASMYALVLATGLIGVLINAGMRQIERRILSWHSSVRSEVIV